jgi:hypothetical protein
MPLTGYLAQAKTPPEPIPKGSRFVRLFFRARKDRRREEGQCQQDYRRGRIRARLDVVPLARRIGLLPLRPVPPTFFPPAPCV